MNVLDRLRLRQRQKIVVALLMTRAAAEPVTTEMLLDKAELLDLRAHRAVHDQDAFTRRPTQRLFDLGAVRLGGNVTEKGADGGHGKSPVLKTTNNNRVNHIKISLCQHMARSHLAIWTKKMARRDCDGPL
ncbi:hypothetical protein D9M72_483530 [compost metagenome]